MISPQQYRKLMKTHNKAPNVSRAAMHAGIDRKTARKYLNGAPGPEEPHPVRHWRTHPDAFEEVWLEVERELVRDPQLQAKTVFEELLRRHPGKFVPGQRRSFERRVRRWKLTHGKEAQLVFVQEHRPGERLQLDWWDAVELGILIGGEPYRHKLVTVVLPYSNWQWAKPCRSESFLSLKSGLQAALWELGAAPVYCQTDQSSTATHPKGKGQKGREFNERYLSLLAYYHLRPATIAVATPEQNGDVETGHRHLKDALFQALSLRGSREFPNLASYEEWLKTVLRGRNALREKALAEELPVMQALPLERLPEYDELAAYVSREALVRVGRQAYSVPARYIGERVRVRMEELWLSFYWGEELIERVERQPGVRKGVFVNWRHVLPQLLRRPGAMLRWRHRASLFPNALWRRAFDLLLEQSGQRRGEREYLRLLELALEHGQERVEAELTQMGDTLSITAIRERFGVSAEDPAAKIIVVDFQADLQSYDGLLSPELQQSVTRLDEEVAHGA